MMKRVLIGLGVLLVLLASPFVYIYLTAFAGMMPLVDGTELPGGARLVKDGFVAINVLPAGDKEVALVDCGNDANGVALMAELKRRGLGPEAVKAIFLTHGHADHIAACHLFKDAQVLVLPGDIPVAEGTGRAKGFMPSMLDTPVEKRVKVTRPLVDGETVAVGPLNVKVYAVPGHTAGSASFLANEVLFMGDNAGAASDGSMRGAPPPFSDSSAENQKSLEALAKRLVADGASVQKTAFAHTGPVDGMAALQAFKAKE
jgi:glyoxylase-like metal-dependent hydrolase (beta-lactamase superfamily II)